MKKITLLTSIVFLTTLLLFTSCNKDDETSETTILAGQEDYALKGSASVSINGNLGEDSIKYSYSSSDFDYLYVSTIRYVGTISGDTVMEFDFQAYPDYASYYEGWSAAWRYLELSAYVNIATGEVVPSGTSYTNTVGGTASMGNSYAYWEHYYTLSDNRAAYYEIESANNDSFTHDFDYKLEDGVITLSFTSTHTESDNNNSGDNPATFSGHISIHPGASDEDYNYIFNNGDDSYVERKAN